MVRPQQTLSSAIRCVGVGLHSGKRVSLVLRPAGVDAGIVFARTDLGTEIEARYDAVIDTRLCTVIGRPGASVGTVEHLMAAFAGCGVDNAIVEVDGPELPILDGSSASFVFLIECAGLRQQSASVRFIEVLRDVRVEAAGGAFAALSPSADGLRLEASIDFADEAIGRQSIALSLSPETFRRDLARARTFTRLSDVEQMRTAGLALGGSLENAIVVDGARVLNPEGLRFPDEFVRHKTLDAVGDLALAGGSLQARYVSHKAGHALNNQVLRALFADGRNWRLAGGPGGGALVQPQAAAAPVA
jgi:UDP-3-O-[3-hydroxymyristoyl] N-acetylglucosamine deacetylase